MKLITAAVVLFALAFPVQASERDRRIRAALALAGAGLPDCGCSDGAKCLCGATCTCPYCHTSEALAKWHRQGWRRDAKGQWYRLPQILPSQAPPVYYYTPTPISFQPSFGGAGGGFRGGRGGC